MPLEHAPAEFPETPLVGESIRTSNARAHEIGALWSRLLGEQRLEQIPHKASGDVFSVYTDYESDHTGEYTLFVGCPVTRAGDVPEGMSTFTLSGGTYARIALPASDPGTIAAAWQEIWSSELGARRAFAADFDRYHTPAGEDEQQAEIWLSVR